MTSRWIGIAGCVVTFAGCSALKNRANAVHSQNAWEDAQRHAVLLDNPAAAGRVVTDGKQDAGASIVGLRSYGPDSLCFSVDADSNSVWLAVNGFAFLVFDVLGQEEGKAATQSNAVESPIRTHTVVGTQRERTGNEPEKLVKVDIPYEERAVCFSNPSILGPRAAELVFRIDWNEGSHAYFAWKLTANAPQGAR